MSIRRVLVIASLGLLGAGGVAGVVWWRSSRVEPVAWRTGSVARQDVKKVVSSTGILNADPSVDVGTQVSGIVSELLVDFNAKVEKGQVLARIDPTLLDADLASAQARLTEAVAQDVKAAAELHRMQALHDHEAATDQELEAASASAAVASAQVQTARVSVARARRNLDYATITAPVAGTIVKRSVNLGQTVNAGFSAPTLFTLASDLSHMIILANVDESDVGQVHPDQVATFTVQAFPDRTFTGKVRQVRLDARTDQGVVTYTTVVDVENTDGALFPGMTATVEFIVAEAKDAFCTPNAALRFRPDSTMPIVGDVPEGAVDNAADLAATAAAEKQKASAGGGGGSRGGGPPGGSAGGRRKRGAEGGPGVLWTQDGEHIRAIPVTTGLRGADCTEVSGEGLSADLPVILGVDRSVDATKSSSPFSRSSSGGPGKPGGF